MERQTTTLSSKGFTLVELLVVIGILGVLIVALIAALDPLEQIRRGTDGARKSSAVQLKNALDRFYTVNGAFPWNGVAWGAGACHSGAAPSGTPVVLDSAIEPFDQTCLTANATNRNLVTDAEIKDTFILQPALRNPVETPVPSALWISEIVVDDRANVAICFNPESRAESVRPETRYDKLGAAVAACNPPTAAGTCYWCAR